MASTQQLESWLAEAETAYHALQTGKTVVEFRDSNGETVRYTPANSARLAAYIANLKQQLSVNPSGPMFLVMS